MWNIIDWLCYRLSIGPVVPRCLVNLLQLINCVAFIHDYVHTKVFKFNVDSFYGLRGQNGVLPISHKLSSKMPPI